MTSGWVARGIVDRVVDFAVERGIQRRRLDAIVGPRTGMPVRGDTAHAALAYVVRELGDPASVWHMATRARPADYGPYGFALQASETLRDALVRASRFFASVGTTAEMAVSTHGEATRLVVRRRDGATSPGARLGTQYIAGQMVRLIAAITGEQVRPRAVHLQHRPWGSLSSCHTAVGVAPAFHAPVTCIEIDRVSLDMPLPRRDPDLTRHFDGELQRDEHRSTSAAARRAIEQAIRFGGSTAEDHVARALGMGMRTLRRRLAEEGTSLRIVLDGVRLEIATERLGRPHASLAELALELGFSDQTALSRAFRRWTRCSPAEFRRSVLR